MEKLDEILIRIPYYEKFTEICTECGSENHVVTQKDQVPEYYTDIYIKCEFCGNSIEFNLPVN